MTQRCCHIIWYEGVKYEESFREPLACVLCATCQSVSQSLYGTLRYACQMGCLLEGSIIKCLAQSSSGPSCPSRKVAIRWHRCSSEPSSAYARIHCIRKSSGTWLG